MSYLKKISLKKRIGSFFYLFVLFFLFDSVSGTKVYAQHSILRFCKEVIGKPLSQIFQETNKPDGDDLKTIKQILADVTTKLDNTTSQIKEQGRNIAEQGRNIEEEGKNTRESIRELRAGIEEQGKNIAEQGRQINKVLGNVGESNNTIGAFVESVIGASLLRVYTDQWAIEIADPSFPLLEDVSLLLKGKKDFLHDKQLDFILLGRNEIVIVEAKTRLRKGDISQLLNYLNRESDLERILELINAKEKTNAMQRGIEDSEIGAMKIRTPENTKIYGAFGYFKYGSQKEEVKELARNKGLFLIRGVPHGIAEIINLESTQFRDFSDSIVVQ